MQFSPLSQPYCNKNAMATGQMDPAGEGLTKAGKICGMISVILTIAGIGLGLVIMLLIVGARVGGGP